MIRIYDKATTDFTYNGLGILKDAITCIVEEELNGYFILTLEYPVNGFLSEYLINENIIKAPAGLSTGNDQLFKINRVEQTLSIMTVTANHIFYDLKVNMLEDVRPTSLNGAGALDYILTHTKEPHNFTGFSDIENIDTAYYILKNPVEALLGVENSFINRWGGELLRDNFLIKMLQARGQNRGVKLLKGKNIKEIQWNINDSGVYTRIYPKGFNGLEIDEKYINSPLIDDYEIIKATTIEFSDIKVDEENGITEEMAKLQLRNACYNLFDSGIDKPIVNIDFDFIELSKTEQYKKIYSAFESVFLGDIVEAKIGNIHLTLKIISTTYNSLLEKYESFIIGDVKENYVSSAINQLQKINNEIQAINPTGILKQAQQNATNLITNFSAGGYRYFTQDEIYIMDTDNPNTATKVWRWNLNGLGYSSTGINGDYELAMTMDGRIVADFITTGILEGSLIKAGSITADKISTEALKIGGSNLIKNSARYFNTNWVNIFPGITDTEIKQKTDSKNCFFVGNNSMSQEIQVQNNIFTISWTYKKLIELADIKIIINGKEIPLTSMEWEKDSYTFEVLSNTIEIKVESDTDESCYLSDLMCNFGVVPHVWSSAPGESINGGVKIAETIEITSEKANTKQIMDHDGNRVINTNTDEVVAEYTDMGMKTKKLEAQTAVIAGLSFSVIGNQIVLKVVDR